MFTLTSDPIVAPALSAETAGGYVTFEGKVRNHNEGKPVLRLEYEAFGDLAEKEGNQILESARILFDLVEVRAIHRTGLLEIGEVAVWIGVAAAHRAEAFRACEFIIDEIKQSVPIWKKEHYADGASEWIGVSPRCVEDRFARQIILPEIGTEGQEKLKAARVLVIGAGGLGCGSLPYLAAAGVGTIGICDPDKVEVSNLHRQVLYGPADCGYWKAQVAAVRLGRLSPEAAISPMVERLTASNAGEIVSGYDVVVDGTDNFATKFLLNEVCVAKGIPLVIASLHKFEGQILTIDGEGCLRCLWPEAPYDGCVGNCAEEGTVGVVPGLFGVLQANEAIKHIIGMPTLRDRMLTFDLATYESHTLARARRPDCPVCGDGAREERIDLDYASIQTMGLRMVDIRDLDEEGGPGFERIPQLSSGKLPRALYALSALAVAARQPPPASFAVGGSRRTL